MPASTPSQPFRPDSRAFAPSHNFPVFAPARLDPAHLNERLSMIFTPRYEKSLIAPATRFLSTASLYQKHLPDQNFSAGTQSPVELPLYCGPRSGHTRWAANSLRARCDTPGLTRQSRRCTSSASFRGLMLTIRHISPALSAWRSITMCGVSV